MQNVHFDCEYGRSPLNQNNLNTIYDEEEPFWRDKYGRNIRGVEAKAGPLGISDNSNQDNRLPARKYTQWLSRES